MKLENQIFIVFGALLLPFILTCVAGCFLLCRADPVIEGIARNPLSGDITGLHGEGFGTKNPAAPLKHDDFESGTPDEDLSDWVLATSHGRNPCYSTDFLRTNSTRSAKCSFDSVGANLQWGCVFGYQSDVGIMDVYLDAWYLYIPADPVSAMHKVFRYYADNSANPTVGLAMTCAEGASTWWWAATDLPFPHGATLGWGWESAESTWVHIQGYLKHASAPDVDDGIMKLWIDAALLADATNLYTRTTGEPSLLYDLWLGDMCEHSEVGACPASPGSTYTYWENVYIDTCRARVEIGNASTYENCTHRETQVPSAWSDTNISFTFDRGSLGGVTWENCLCSTPRIWFYVVDSNGDISTGFLLR